MVVSTNSRSVVILAAGGTGGHVFPARALAEELMTRGLTVVLMTDQRGLKYFEGLDQVERFVIASGAYQSGIKGKILGILGLAKGYFQSHRILSRFKPLAVVGFGGYPSAPPVFAAQHRCIPTVIHEQNAILGLANALLAPRAKRISLSTQDTTGLKPQWAQKCITTGNPVRHDIAALAEEPYPEMTGKLCLTIVGGSQGAKSFATIVPHSVVGLPEELRKRLFVFHQARPDDLDAVKAIYEGSGIETDIRPFFDNMAECIGKSHLLITRSGASTIAELGAAGRPAIFIPFPWNRDNQQFFNAEQVAKHGGGCVIEEKNLTVDGLRDKLAGLLENPAQLETMARKASLLGITDATKRLTCVISGVLPGGVAGKFLCKGPSKAQES
ncbi:MAG: undecaprenyldiphospho-muramoylpentapeptide beta-N-acetylglucosaminyltransferase [Alphaproteobacteria bacterium CG1_02_46_17]|nr:MAG: undecaprenyldiphospho-muramoylpentapeptide beta-N-acetylglucosaminyltransferase [Alphaproteobacteria bacterium CG1_02_46_17]